MQERCSSVRPCEVVDSVSETGQHGEKKGESKQPTAKYEIGACRIDRCSDKVPSIDEDVVTLVSPNKAPLTMNAGLGKKYICGF